jgi:hypothetical protein
MLVGLVTSLPATSCNLAGTGVTLAHAAKCCQKTLKSLSTTASAGLYAMYRRPCRPSKLALLASCSRSLVLVTVANQLGVADHVAFGGTP